MSIVKSFSVGHGDMFAIRHNSDNFTIIDCSIADDDQLRLLGELYGLSRRKTIKRFVSTHPDDDHICGLEFLDDCMAIVNFYCVANAATKDDVTDDFRRYCELRDSPKAFKLYAGCRRRWMNQSDSARGAAGLHIHWPKTDHPEYALALEDAADGWSPNNISIVMTYQLKDGPSFMWMGDLETYFMEAIENQIDLPEVDVLFAPHHGRHSGKVPASMLHKISPQLVVIGEAPSEHLNYYEGYNTITQNSAGDITFDCVDGFAHVYVSSSTYTSGALLNQYLPNSDLGYYIGSIDVAAGKGVGAGA